MLSVTRPSASESVAPGTPSLTCCVPSASVWRSKLNSPVSFWPAIVRSIGLPVQLEAGLDVEAGDAERAAGVEAAVGAQVEEQRLRAVGLGEVELAVAVGVGQREAGDVLAERGVGLAGGEGERRRRDARGGVAVERSGAARVGDHDVGLAVAVDVGDLDGRGRAGAERHGRAPADRARVRAVVAQQQGRRAVRGRDHVELAVAVDVADRDGDRGGGGDQVGGRREDALAVALEPVDARAAGDQVELAVAVDVAERDGAARRPGRCRRRTCRGRRSCRDARARRRCRRRCPGRRRCRRRPARSRSRCRAPACSPGRLS